MEKNNIKCVPKDIDRICAPGKKFSEGSCFSMKQLKKIAESYNNKYPDDKINITNNKRDLLIKLIKNIKKQYSCGNQTCWLGLDIIQELEDTEINDFTLRPEGPNGEKEWLSTTDINNVLKQYQNKFSDFFSGGAVPYDFEELDMLGFKNINFQNYIDRGKYKFGLVINLDTHDKSGSHWVSLFANFNKKQIYFFDSFGGKPGKRIRKFINKIAEFMSKKKYNNEIIKNLESVDGIDLRYNKIQHQLKNTECGVYSINFIIRLSDGESFESITNNITKDNDMNSCRKLYFRN